MSAPRVVAVAPASPAARAGLTVGDEIVALNGETPRDVIRYQLLADEAELTLDVRRGGLELTLDVAKREGEALGAEVHAAVFDQVQTCDNHCEFCFIYQLPPGLRRSLYLKDDDYRLSFLYGNFTTLTRFTEADLERVVTEGLSPLNVSIHATDPDVRAEMLRNRRGATSLRWLRALLDHGVDVHGQIVVCPGVNDGAVLDDTLAGVLDRFPELASVCVVPLGVSRFNREDRMRPHTPDEARAVVEAVHDWQEVFHRVLGHRVAFAADEYYLLAGLPFPDADAYEGFPMHEDGIGMARTFEARVRRAGGRADRTAVGLLRLGRRRAGRGLPGAPNRRCGGRPTRHGRGSGGAARPPRRTRRRAHRALRRAGAGPTARRPSSGRRADRRGAQPVLRRQHRRDRPDGGRGPRPRCWPPSPRATATCCPTCACRVGGSSTAPAPAELPRPVEVVATDGIALRAALEASERHGGGRR